MKFYGFLLTLVFVWLVLGAKKDYTDYKIVQVSPLTIENGRLLAGLESTNTDFDILNSPKNAESSFDILLSPQAFEKYSTIFREHGMPFTVSHNNVQELVDKEEKELESSRMDGRVVGTYPRLSALLAWMDDVANSTSIASATVSSIGKSFQGRDLKILVIKAGTPSKRIWFDCGIHAREWISPATCVNLIDKFLNDYKKGDPTAVAILMDYELHFLPVLNPDGYEYSWAGERFWRKSRNTNVGSTCPGTDLNRNFPYKWFTGGSSDYSCLDTFAGSASASEPETKAVINYISGLSNWSAYISLHSYGNWFLTPFGYTTALPSDYATHKAVGDVFANAVKSVYGEIFTVGSSANLLYIASGCSADWAYGDMNITHSYTIELRPRGGSGVASFDLSILQLPKVGDEIYAGIKALIGSI